MRLIGLIEDIRLSINNCLDALDAVLANIQSEQSGVKKIVEDLELAMTGCDTLLNKVERVYEELRSENKFFRAKVNDLEGLYLKFIGIKEGAEQGQPVEFVSELISMLFGRDKFSKPINVDCAHKTLRPRLTES